MMRNRCCGERLVTKVSAISRTTHRTNWPQAARENDSSRAAMRMSSTTLARTISERRPTSTRWNASSAGSITKAPSTLGSLKVPRARP